MYSVRAVIRQDVIIVMINGAPKVCLAELAVIKDEL